eukprot:ANDGO_01348.mRNA.1 Vegetative incompatibility protein HET-E-1
MKEQPLSDVLRELKRKCIVPIVDKTNGGQVWKTSTHRYTLDNSRKIAVYAFQKEFQCVHTFEGHSSAVCNVVISPDGLRIVSRSDDKTVKVWQDGQCVQTLDGHSSFVCCVALSPDGNRIATGSDDRTVKVWQDGQCVQTLNGHSSSVCCVSFSPDGNRIATGSKDRTVKVWQDGQCIQTLSGHSGRGSCVSFSPDGNRIATGSNDRTVKVWQDGVCVQTFVGHSSGVCSIAFSPDGMRIATGSADKTVKVWEDGQCVQTFEDHTNSVYSVAFSPDGKRIASGSADKTVKVWKDEQCVQTFEGHTSAVYSVAFSPDGMRIASGSDDKTVKVWDLPFDLKYTATIPTHSPLVTFAVSTDPDCFASVHQDGDIFVWKKDTCVYTVSLRDVDWMAFCSSSILMGEQTNGKAFVIENGRLIWNDAAHNSTFVRSALLKIKTANQSENDCVFGEGASSLRLAEERCDRIRCQEEMEAVQLRKSAEASVAAAKEMSTSLRAYILSLESALDRVHFDFDFFAEKLDRRDLSEIVETSLTSIRTVQKFCSLELKKFFPTPTDENAYSRESIAVGEMVAYGGQGVVHKCIVNNRVAALKEPVFRQVVKANGITVSASETNRRSAFESLRNEYEALCAISSPNVVRPVALLVEDGTNELAGFLQQLCSEGDLVSYLKRVRSHDVLSDNRLFRIALQVALGLSAVRSAGFVHRDVKACNFLVCLDEQGSEIVKIGDLGTADFSEYNQNHTMPIGTTGEFRPTSRYASPEYVGGKVLRAKYQQSVSHDLWGYGHVLYECATGKIPYYEEEEDRDAEDRIRDGETPTWPLDSKVPDWLKSLCEKCWTTSPEMRLAAFPCQFQSIVLDLCRMDPETAKGVMIDLARFERAEIRDIFVTASPFLASGD